MDNFRALKHFEMDGLGRINLLVGMNNFIKSSILEAVHILTAADTLQALWSTLARRGEQSQTEAG